MATSRLARWARWCHRRRWRVLGAWAALLVVVGVAASSLGGTTEDDFRIPDAESQRALDVLQQRFPDMAGDNAMVVFDADGGLEQPANRGRVEQVVEGVRRLDHVLEVTGPFDGPGQVSADGRIAFAAVQFDAPADDIPQSTFEALRDVAGGGASDDLRVELGGRAVEFSQQGDTGQSEQVGLIAAALVLLLTFGSVLAAGLPLGTALFGLGAGLGIVTLASTVVPIPEAGPQVATMIGLGVGIDYALFIVTRYRHGLHSGLDAEEATGVAIATSGRAVLFAGVTVVISLLGLLLVDLAFVRGLAVAASLVVLLTMAASISLLPALFGLIGDRVDRLRVPFLHRREDEHRQTVWFKFSRVIQRRPWPAAILGTTALVVLALPLLSMRLGVTDAGADPESRSTRRAYDLLSEGFGPGFNGPLLLTASLPGDGDHALLDDLVQRLGETEGVALVAPPETNEAGDTAVVVVIPTTAPQDEATTQLIHRLRDEVVPSVTGSGDGEVLVGGITAAFVDVTDLLSRDLPLFIGAVLGVSFLLLMVVFRSIAVPLKAVVMNLLSIGAAYGIVVAVFQWGWGAELLGLGEPGPIQPFVPMMLFAILFGLSMDYEVFLISRVREEWLRTGDNGLAVADGLAFTARVITAAAAIMVTIFGSFLLADDAIIKVFGLGLAVAILLDATVVRVVLVPATMELLGDANWKLPRWLDRVLPHLDIEAAAPEDAAEDAGDGVRDLAA